MRPASLTPLLLLALTLPTRANLITDPKPPLSWDALLKCNFIAIGTLQKTKQSTLELKVTRLLRGDPIKPTDHLIITLDHWYALTPGTPPKPPPATSKKDPRGAPIPTGQLHYQYPLLPNEKSPPPTRTCLPSENYGDQPLLFFFPSRQKLILDTYQQVQRTDDGQIDEWTNLLAAKPASPYFLILQSISPDQRTAAIAQWQKTRDPALRDRLLNWLTGPQGLNHLDQSQSILSALGDQNGDIFQPLLQDFDAAAQNDVPPDPLARLAVAADPKAAFDAFSRRATAGPAPDAALATLAWIPTPECLDFLLTRLAAPPNPPDRPVLTMNALESILHIQPQNIIPPEIPQRPPETPAQLAALRTAALPRLQSLATAPNLDPAIRQRLKSAANQLSK